MRLLNTHTIQLEEFFDKVPPYAILSHTWADEEVTFQDLEKPYHTAKVGYANIKETCRLARDDGYQYVWIDTCCIDKSSSAELSEAINSMFNWYKDASICYAYLADVSPTTTVPTEQCSPFGESRWFQRGWTLQELLASPQLVFYSSDWAPIASKNSLKELISQITNIDEAYLISQSKNIAVLLEKASIAERMSWASKRQTTRVEDIAYCLLGIFGLNMPLLYGEGKRAFLRLQEEIVRRFDDQSIFAWTSTIWDTADPEPLGFLADSPGCFAQSGHIIRHATYSSSSNFSITNKGLGITLRMLESALELNSYVLLQCQPRNAASSMVAVRLQKVSQNSINGS
ncbi:hypothetical protein BP6252_13998 [Coleophoma cylindrospora]|uniref:Uncharacterized protein n=1 Tax=Coleophoma cylindrospora TaxID=1849047 RepID=A0A3D8Q4J8_9HELO|nr:hypothetical protein BP6252_13998 [Coleophoma cylindrospora]